MTDEQLQETIRQTLLFTGKWQTFHHLVRISLLCSHFLVSSRNALSSPPGGESALRHETNVMAAMKTLKKHGCIFRDNKSKTGGFDLIEQSH